MSRGPFWRFAMSASHLASGGRYPVLRSIAILYVIGGVATAVLGTIASIWSACILPDSAAHAAALCFLGLAATFFVAISMFAIAEVLKLFIDIEHNSRMVQSDLPMPESTASTMMPNNGGHRTRIQWMQGEETAEGALLRGH
jgi:hypothetical protein